ncbi:MAG TPA: NHLP family bacteriocin export ABC transporter peptidase/permease/ATPase subunit [Pseudomonadota bacterium]|nr:NHLP family bacteriocin export ABC transporter peptidase/permease/ATPase subunit [Pseudomonadota bacterium]
MTTEQSAEPPRAAPRLPRRVKTQMLLQMEAADCGAASLGIILSYFGRYVSLAALREACGVSRDGSKASNLLKAARDHGLVAKGLKLDLDPVRQTQPPFIVFWNFNHFLVVEGFSRRSVYLNDPARGRRKVTWDEFAAAYTGVTLTFEPGPQFQRADDRASIYAALWPRLSGSRQALAYVILVGLLLVVPGLLIPGLSRTFLDEILIGGAHDWLGPLLLAMGATLFLRGALTALYRHYLGRLEAKLALSAASQFLWHMLRLPTPFYNVRNPGDLIDRVGANEDLAVLLSGELAESAIQLIVTVFYAALLYAHDRTLFGIALLTALVTVLTLRWLGQARIEQSLRLQQDRGKLYGTSVQGVQQIESIKASGSENDFFIRLAGYQTKVTNGEQDLAASSALLDALLPLISTLSHASVLGIGALHVMEGRLSMGELVAVQSLTVSFLTPLRQLAHVSSTVQLVQGTLRRLEDVLQHPQDPGLPSTAQIAKTLASPLSMRTRLTGAIELRGIRFGYSRLAPPLIDDFSLTLRPGSRIALVGGSGSGKSTIAKLVAGLLQPWAGEIRFDGELRPNVPRALLKHSLAVVDQDIFLFEGSIRENITMWDASIPEPQVVAAAKDARIHEDIAQRERGYDSAVEEGGRNFSGGQRQRLEIARALLHNPSILILDEATSALDPLTEQQIDHSLRWRGCTCILVAHRLSTIRDCEEILVLDRGQIVERGTHEDLLKRGGAYAQLIKSA